jgi:hypothetical protein
MVLAAGELGPMPRLDGGVFVGATLRAGFVAADIEGAWLGSQAADLTPGVGGDFSLWQARGRGCAEFGIGPAEVAPCAGLEVDWMRGEGFGTEATHIANAHWVAGLAGGYATLWIARFVGVRLQGDVALPFARPRFVLVGAGAVHRPAPEFGGAELGVEVLF